MFTLFTVDVTVIISGVRHCFVYSSVNVNMNSCFVSNKCFLRKMYVWILFVRFLFYCFFINARITICSML